MPDGLAIATALVKRCEGCRLAPYQDVAGIYSIAFGSRHAPDGSPVTAKTQSITLGQAVGLLNDTLLSRTAPGVARMVSVALSDCQAGALISLAYNIGCTALAESTLLAELNRGDFAGAAAQFDRWIYAGGHPVKGLVARRALEKAVFLGTLNVSGFAPVPIPGAPHPAFASRRPTTLSTDNLNAAELALLRHQPTISA